MIFTLKFRCLFKGGIDFVVAGHLLLMTMKERTKHCWILYQLINWNLNAIQLWFK